MPRRGEGRDGDRCHVAAIDVRNLAVSGSRVDDAFFDDVLGLSEKILHEMVRPEHRPCQPRFLQLLLDVIVPPPIGAFEWSEAANAETFTT